MNPPSDDDLLALIRGDLDPAEQERLEEQLSSSEELRNRLEQLAKDGSPDLGITFDAFPTDAPLPNPRALEEVISDLKGGSPLPPDSPPPSTLDAFLDFLSPSDDPSSAGRLGEFEIEDVIAAGGMGVVFKARDPGLNRHVAVKMLSPTFAANATARERFLREASAAGAIDHPNVIPIHSVDDTSTSLPFIVMRLVEGGTLEDRLTPGLPLPLEESLPVIRAVAAALAAAHEKKLIHRDIKPSNILLDDSNIFLSDFGLARAEEDSQAGLTQSGAFLGTPRFMSPEQAAGSAKLDQRSDLFSLGALVYAMVTGHPPFRGSNFAELAEQVREEAPIPPRDHVPALPPWLSHLILRLLAKDPRDRLSSASDIVNAIDEEQDLGSVAPTLLTGGRFARRRLRRRLASAAAILLALSAVAFAASEKSGRTHIVNAALCARSGNSFFLSGRWGTFEQLDTAIATAPPGSEILVRTNDTVTITPVRIEDPEQSLTIRAAPGFRPVLKPSPETPGLLIGTRAPLTLEGLVFHDFRAAAIESNSFIGSENAPLRIVNCRLARRLGSKSGDYLPRKVACISVTDCPRLEVLNSEILTIRRPALFLGTGRTEGTGPCSIHIENSIVYGRILNLQSRGDRPINTTLRHNLLLSSTAIELHGVPTTSHPTVITFEASDNLIQSTEDWIRIHNPTPEQTAHLLDWNGDNNIYIVVGALLHSDKFPAPISDLKTWRAFWESDRPGNTPDRRSLFTKNLVQEKVPHRLGSQPTPYRFEIPQGQFDRLPNAGPDYETVGPGPAYHNHHP